jgi:hypothetical protein
MELVSRTGGGNFIIGKTINMVTRSQYGRRLPQNLTRDVRQARTLVGPVGLSYFHCPWCVRLLIRLIS